MINIKAQLKRFWKWITFLILGGVALAATLQQPTINEISLEKVQQKYEQSTEIKSKYTLDGASLIRHEIKNAELDKYKNEPKDEIKVILGDKDKAEFVPNIELKRWNEVSFKIKTDNLLKNVETKDRELEFADNKIKFKTPKMEFEMEDFDDSYKFIWYLNEKPATNKVEFQIESSGLDFFYQPPLTQEYQNGYSEEFQKEIVVTETQVKDLEGNVLVERPENVVGSYAVYHSTKGGMNDINGKDYKTGQAFFVYRPKIIDAQGKETWGILKIENGIYSVEIPQDFLDTAIYPIKSNDTFGYTTKGGSYGSVGTGGTYLSLAAPAGGDGSVDTISVWCRSDSGYYFKEVLWTSGKVIVSPNGVGNTIGDAADTLLNINYTNKPSVINATNYYVGVIGSGATSVYYNAGGGAAGGYSSNSYNTPTNLGTITTNYLFSVYATYTPAAPPAAAEPEMRVIIIE